jgi:cystathionine gamma-synthase
MRKGKLSSTECVHAGSVRDEETFSITPPIVHSAPFAFKSTHELLNFMEGRSERRQPEYGRMGNPTVMAVEKRLAALEGAEKAQLFASGMAAVTSLLITILKSGDHIILTNDCYRRTRDFGFFMTKYGVTLDVVEPSVEGIRTALKDSTRLIFTEIPTNPYLHFVDLEELVSVVKKKKQDILIVADSTFATPINFRPLEVGADLVIHSATKYLGGHNDLIAGVLLGSEELVQPVSEMLMTLGGITDPNTAFLLGRGIKTLGIRVARQNEGGQAVAEFLENHPKIQRIFYPGLPSHPSHAVATKLMSGFGGVVTFLVEGDLEATARFINKLEIPRLAPSLGGVEALVDHVAVMSFWNLSGPERRELGITDNLVRFALGIEDVVDLIADLEQALEVV